MTRNMRHNKVMHTTRLAVARFGRRSFRWRLAMCKRFTRHACGTTDKTLFDALSYMEIIT